MSKLNKEKKERRDQILMTSMIPKDNKQTGILDGMRLQEMCAEICGRADVLDDKVVSNLSVIIEQMVENVIDFSCTYATHRESDTLEKEDVAFAVSRLFPEVSKDHKVRDVQLVIDQ